eukprot:TRINITY_DN48845_c0_g1_i1.p1 TRINITY_DN48845_c0_g1~~TRINITY_DN48845_c0_g1_i1.p1  ORF type:complete len:918 (-),score=169.33 TRINITY_DN48845_c0_g1_i1:302-3055(-)
MELEKTTNLNPIGGAPDEIDFGAIMELMTSRYTLELVDRHVAAIRRLCKTCCNGFLLQHLEPLVELLRLAVQRFSEGQDEMAPAICEFTRVASQPFVSCKTSDMITYGHHLPNFIKVLVSVLLHSAPPTDEVPSTTEDPQARVMFENQRSMRERIRIEVAHTLACWSRFGLDEDSVELRPNQPLIQAVADSGTPNLRILRQSQVMDALSSSFRAEDSPEAIVVTLGAIRDMSLYRPLARQITNCGLISNLVHVIRVNLLGSDVLLVAAEVLWNVLELDWEGATEALGQEEVIESFRDFMDAVLTRGYRFKDKIFRNDMMVLLMYMSKRVENRPLFATTGLMALLLSYAVSEQRRKVLQRSGVLAELCRGPSDMADVLPDVGSNLDSAKEDGSVKGVALTNTQEDMEFRMLLWGTLARCCSSEPCAQVAVRCGFLSWLLECLDAVEAPAEQRQWSQEQRRKVQLEALSALFQLVQYVPDAFMQAQGNAVVLQLLQATRSREVQKKCLHLLQVAVRVGPEFPEDLGRLGAVGTLLELFTDKDNPMSSRQLCASVLAGLCKGNSSNCKEFRKKDGIEAIREEVVYKPNETTDNHLFYTLCVVDCVWNAVVGTRKNEIRFLDAGGLFALLDALEVAPLILKRQIIGCLADLMEYRKAAKLFTQWNSQVTMKGALKMLLELWQSEQEAAINLTHEGVIRDLERPLNPRDPIPGADVTGEVSLGGGEHGLGNSRTADKLKHAKAFADTAGNVKGSKVAKQDVEAVQDRSRDQDCRAKIYSVLKCIGFECQETLSIAERQHMELVKLYPHAVELEMWMQVQENLEAKGIKPISADRKWIEDSIAERKEQANWVQGMQKKLANEKRREEEAGLIRFYEDIMGRAQIRRITPAQNGGYPLVGRDPGMNAGTRAADAGEDGFSDDGL